MASFVKLRLEYFLISCKVLNFLSSSIRLVSSACFSCLLSLESIIELPTAVALLIPKRTSDCGVIIPSKVPVIVNNPTHVDMIK